MKTQVIQRLQGTPPSTRSPYSPRSPIFIGEELEIQRKEETQEECEEIMVLNMGPQHPSTHGVLRIILKLEGEVIIDAVPVIGYLHRGIEKLMESKTYHQVITLTDRFDYLSPLVNNLAYCLAVEKLLGLEIPPRGQYLRVILAELTRLESHLMWLGSQANDIGAITPLLYTFRDRESLLDLFEMAGGSRMHTSYIRIGGLLRDVPPGFIPKVKSFCEAFPRLMKDYEGLLTKNPIWHMRTRGIGVISAKEAINLGLSGPILRASGVSHDLRKDNPYSGYDQFEFDIPVEKDGDVYARYLVRLEEMRQSINILRQAVEKLPGGPINAGVPQVVPPGKHRVVTDIESLIHHFHIMVEGFKVPAGEVYSCVESPRGELGYYICSDGSSKPFRVKVRTPSFVNLQALAPMVKGRLMADVVAIIGSIDFILGDADK
jgi:NADH-quinone oxidoreductase subunit D